MPKVTFGRRISPEINDAEWIGEFRRLVKREKLARKITYQTIAESINVTPKTLYNKLRNGDFSVEEFSGIANLMQFPDDVVLRLVRTRKFGG